MTWLSETPCPKIFCRLKQLFTGIHHKWPHLGDRLANRLTIHEEHPAPILTCSDADAFFPFAEDRQLMILARRAPLIA